MEKFRIEIKETNHDKLRFVKQYKAELKFETVLEFVVAEEELNSARFDLKTHLKDTVETKFNSILKETCQLDKIERLTRELLANIDHLPTMRSKAYDILKVIDTCKMCKAEDFTM